MARPKKNTLPETEVAATTPEVVGINNDEITTAEVATSPEPVQATLETPSAATPEMIFPEADRVAMAGYIRVINNSNQASRIMQTISHQKDLEMWGVHQYDDNQSRNTYSRSFYFRDRQNAAKALEHANKLIG